MFLEKFAEIYVKVLPRSGGPKKISFANNIFKTCFSDFMISSKAFLYFSVEGSLSTIQETMD